MRPSLNNEPERWLGRWLLIRQGRLAEALSEEERRWLLEQFAEPEPSSQRRPATLSPCLTADRPSRAV